MNELEKIEDRLRQPVDFPDDSDWHDVVRRAERTVISIPPNIRWRALRRRPVVVLAGAACLLSLVFAVPAFGLNETVVDWFSAPSAPGSAQEAFDEFDVGAPQGMAPNVSGAARSVMETSLAGTTANLWVAPTQQGGFCIDIEGYGGGCDRDRAIPIATVIAPTATTAVLFGDLLSAQARSLELRFADGESVSIPITPVSAPIDASFFEYELPEAAMDAAKWPATVAAMSADGSTIDTETVYWSPTPPTEPRG